MSKITVSQHGTARITVLRKLFDNFSLLEISFTDTKGTTVLAETFLENRDLELTYLPDEDLRREKEAPLQWPVPECRNPE